MEMQPMIMRVVKGRRPQVATSYRGSQSSWQITSPIRDHTCNSRTGCPSPRTQSKSKLRKVLQKEEKPPGQATAQPAINGHFNGHGTTTHLQYVLCSSHFNDIVIIHPPNIDSCSLNENYQVPSFKEVRNLYFKTLKWLHNSRWAQAQNGFPLSPIDDVKA